MEISSDARHRPGFWTTEASTRRPYMPLLRGLGVIVALLGVIGLSPSSGTPLSASSLAARAPDPKAELLHNVALEYSWRKSAVGSVMLLDFTVRNPLPTAFKDFRIMCTHYTPSGTPLDRYSRVIFERIPGRQSKTMHEVSMGVIDGQVSTLSCTITDLVIDQ